jgi:hypothetical protein
MVNRMEQLITKCESSRADRDNTEAEFVRTQLELAFSLLDIAAVTERAKIVRGCVHNAVSAVRTATRFLAHEQGDEEGNSDIWQRQDELVRRVREVARHRRTGRSPHAVRPRGRHLS